MPADRPTAETPLAEYGPITPITLPVDGRMPDPATGGSSKAEYDDYFRLIRERPDLAAWSRSCLDVQRQVLADLDLTELSAEDRCDILAGCLVVLHATLDRWVATGGQRRREVA
ncbi:hypothetical protein K7640_02835 [Micromonospora sp. PLK6-60]|uniref:hypothetical protein n=1 Tax=Micromonospora sp. PLK6-60 TaxID=2873383 RepID=UPI001CA6B68D|nr:hypothetical protein [Micromonospora sp. PLK6-60]MBY8870778.1 hypothetical protein [Micromonospora sp. PLK6-60]